MIKVQVLASGSKGNCTVLTANDATILLDLGINFSNLQRRLNFENPTAVFLTHEHSDHVNKSTLAELLKRGVEVYMTEGTAQALKLEPRHNLHCVTATAIFHINRQIKVDLAPVLHDAAEPINLEIWFGQRQGVVYITDSKNVPLAIDMPAPMITIIEANYATETLLAADIDEHQKQRILHNHLSIEKVAEYFKTADKVFLQEVHLIHISKRHGNAEKFRQIIQEIVGDNVKVFAY